MESNIKKAVALAEQEVQEKEVENLKNIIKKLLEKKKGAEEDKRLAEEEIKVIKQTIDDFKAGRLDKVKEMLEKNPRAKEIAPINITIIQNDNYTRYPLKPWYWNYEVYWLQPKDSVDKYSNLILCNTTSNNYCGWTGTGNTAQVFTNGTYNIGGQIINL